jgi:glycosyltransferase involved in cell wall biosynthesis
MTPFVSVIIPTYKRIELLEKTLQSIVDNNFEQVEIIIINDCLENDLNQTVKKFSNKLNVRWFFNKEHNGPASARNFGVKYARSDLIAFIDDDVIVSKNWLSTGYQVFTQNQDVIGVVGKTILPQNDFPHFFKHFMINEKPGGYPACNFWVRKKEFLKINGFDENFYNKRLKIFHHEDADLCFRLMDLGKIIFYKELITYHPSHSYSFINPTKRARKVYFDPLLKKKHPSKYNELTKKCLGPLCIRNGRVRLRFFVLMILFIGTGFLFKDLIFGLLFLMGGLGAIILDIIKIVGVKNIKKMNFKEWFLAIIINIYSLFIFFFYLIKGMIRFKKFVL